MSMSTKKQIYMILGFLLAFVAMLNIAFGIYYLSGIPLMSLVNAVGTICSVIASYLWFNLAAEVEE